MRRRNEETEVVVVVKTLGARTTSNGLVSTAQAEITEKAERNKGKVQGSRHHRLMPCKCHNSLRGAGLRCDQTATSGECLSIRIDTWREGPHRASATIGSAPILSFRVPSEDVLQILQVKRLHRQHQLGTR